MDGICDDDNSIDVVQMDGLINITSDGKQLSFSNHDSNGMMDCLNYWTVIDVDMYY